MLDSYVSTTIFGICLCIGYLIKHCIPKINNKYIPLINCIIGIALSLFSTGISIESILIGLVSGLSSTGVHQLAKNTILGNENTSLFNISSKDMDDDSEDIDNFKKNFLLGLSEDNDEEILVNIKSTNSTPIIIERLLTPNKYSRPQKIRTSTTKIAWHYTGVANVPALNTAKYFENLKAGYKVNGKYVYASSHYVVGLQGEIYHLVPNKEYAYTTNAANAYSIGIECSHLDDNGKYSEAEYRSMVWLGAKLAKEYKLDPRVDFIRHYDVTKKLCPMWFVKHVDEWERFKQDCYDVLNGKDLDKTIKGEENIPQIENKKSYDFKTICKVTGCSYLSVRDKRPIDNIKLSDTKVLFTLKESECIKLGYVLNNWGYINYNGKYGFVNIKYLQIVN